MLAVSLMISYRRASYWFRLRGPCRSCERFQLRGRSSRRLALPAEPAYWSSAPPPAAVDRNCCCGESTNEYRGKDAHGQISRHAASSGCCTANGGPRHKFRIGLSEQSLPVSGFALQPFGGRLVGIDLARIPLSQLSATEDDERENSESEDEKDRKRQHGKKGERCHGLTRQLVVKGGYQRS